MQKGILIASGGLDSTVLYYYLTKKLRYDVEIVNFNYGSKHNDIERSRLHQNITNTKIHEIVLDFRFLDSSLLKDGAPIPEGHYAEESMKSTVVPFRNGIMLSYAIAIAENKHFDFVALGNHSGDHFIYPDCRTTFIESMNEASAYGTFNNIRILSPFDKLDKAGIVKQGIELGIEEIMFNTWTCYKGKGIHCGKCGACTERKEAFNLNNLEDLTEYE